MRWPTVGAIAAATVILGVSASFVIDEVRIAALPEHEKLKDTPDYVFNPVEKTTTRIEKDEQGNDVEVVETYIEYLHRSGTMERAKNEVVELRTSDSRTFLTDRTFTIRFDAVTPYFQDRDGRWYHTARATTTPEAFQLQMTSVFGVRKAYAQDIEEGLNSGPGTGNQTWTVPGGWNDAANTIECIGAGGDGGPGKNNDNGGGGGGGGAYAAITNLD